MITTKLDFEKLQTELNNTKTQLEELRKVNTDSAKADYEKQIADLKAEVELLKTDEAIKATELYKRIVAESEAKDKTISELQTQIKDVEAKEQDINKKVNMLVREKLASVGVAPIKVQTENKETKKTVYGSPEQYFESLKQK